MQKERKTRTRALLLAMGFAVCGLVPTAGFAATAGATCVFSDTGIEMSSNAGCTADGTDLNITQPGTYVLSGACADGTVKVEKGVRDVQLTLNGLSLSSSDTAPIVCSKSTQVTITAMAGTTNTLSDTERNNDDEDRYPENTNAENAVIKCKDGSQVVIGGTGTLRITANGKNGIKSGSTTQEDGEASLTIEDLTLFIDAPVNDAVNAEQLLSVTSGDLTIRAEDDALHSDYELRIGDNTSGPDIVIERCNEGIEGATVNIMAGDIAINATDDCINAANSDLTGFAFEMNFDGGTIRAYSSEGDGFDSNGTMTFRDGDIQVWTANRADNQPLDADGSITIEGGDILAAGGSGGMGMRMSASQPYVIFGNSGMHPGGNPGDMSGPSGRPEPSGMPTGMPEPSGIPSDMPRPSGMPSGNPDFPGQPDSGTTFSLTTDQDFVITGSDSTSLVSDQAMCDAQYMFYSSGALVSGETYSLVSAETSLAEATAQMDRDMPDVPDESELPEGVTIMPASNLRVETRDELILVTGLVASTDAVTTVDQLEEQFETADGISDNVCAADGTQKEDESAVGTGDVLRFIRADQTIFEGVVVVQGDVIGTGTMSLTQLTRVANAYRGTNPLTGVYLIAADFDGSQTIGLTDVVREAQLLKG